MASSMYAAPAPGASSALALASDPAGAQAERGDASERRQDTRGRHEPREALALAPVRTASPPRGLRARTLGVSAAAVVLLLASCKRTESPPDGATPIFHVPHVRVAPHIDGKVDGFEWAGARRTGDFRDGTSLAAPYSEARFMWSDSKLHVALYAADQDIRSDRDYFTIDFDVPGKPSLTSRVPPRGSLVPPIDGALVGQDTDDTIDDDSDTDEEWTVELSIPLDRIGLHSGQAVRMRILRCDVPKHDVEHCGTWAGRLTLDP